MNASYTPRPSVARTAAYVCVILALVGFVGCRAGKPWYPMASRLANQPPASTLATASSQAAPPATSVQEVQHASTEPEPAHASSNMVATNASTNASSAPRAESVRVTPAFAMPTENSYGTELPPKTETQATVNQTGPEVVMPSLAAKPPAARAVAAAHSPAPMTNQPESHTTASHNSATPANTPQLSATNTIAVAPPPPASTIHLQIANVRPNRGPVKVAVFTSSANFPNKESAVQTLEFDGTTSNATARLAITQACAIAVFQDIDGNGELTTNRFGIPIEPCGFSNNAVIKRGPPSFAAAAVKPASGGPPTLVRIDLP